MKFSTSRLWMRNVQLDVSNFSDCCCVSSVMTGLSRRFSNCQSEDWEGSCGSHCDCFCGNWKNRESCSCYCAYNHLCKFQLCTSRSDVNRRKAYVLVCLCTLCIPNLLYTCIHVYRCTPGRQVSTTRSQNLGAPKTRLGLNCGDKRGSNLPSGRVYTYMSMCMCMHVCFFIYVCMCVLCIFVCVYICLSAPVYMYMCICVYTYIYIYTCYK